MKRSRSMLLASFAGTVLFATGAQGADIRSYTAAKGHLFSQTSATSPVAQDVPYVFRATVEGDLAAITEATVKGPSAFSETQELSENLDGTRFEFEQPFPSLDTMAFFYGNGDYSFTFDSDSSGFDLAQLTLNSTTFPTAIPQISNFTATQSVDADSNFTLTWNSLGDATKWGLIISGPEGEVVAETGTGTTFTIPAGTLMTDTSYDVRLRFAREFDRDTTSVSGAVGTAELFNETQFTLQTGMGGGNPGGDDTQPPGLFFTTPANNAAGVALNTQIMFTFSEPMAPTQAIQWSANVNAANFNYAWTAGGQTLIATYSGGLPANSTISWQLNPTPSNPANFKDVAGNMLPSGVFQGLFMTGGGSGGGTNDPCNGGTPGDSGLGFGSIGKMVNYVQTGNNVPVLDPESGAMFSGTYRGASNQNVTAVSLTGAAGTKTFTGVFGFWLYSEAFSSAAALEAAIPAGNYTINATGAGSATVPLGSTAGIPTPRILNLVELGTMNVSNNFTLNFAGFAGAGANDSIFISIQEENGSGDFTAPNPCKNITLPVTATSVVIPANTFQVGKSYNGSISFSRFGGVDSNSIPSTTVTSGASVMTRFDFTTPTGGGPVLTAPRWTTIRRLANGNIGFTVAADTGSKLIVETSTTFSGWTPVVTNTVVGGSYELVVDPKLAARAMYRAKVQ